MAVKVIVWDEANQRMKRSEVSLPEARAGVVSIPQGASTITVSFQSPTVNTDYAVSCAWEEAGEYAYPSPVVYNKTPAGFELKWPAKVQTTGSKISWSVTNFT